MANETPFGFALSFQRETARMGQRAVEQGIEAQRSMTEAFVRNAVGMGRIANRNATEASRQSAVAVAGMMDAMVPFGADVHPTVDAGFDSVADAQENAWRVFEENAEDGLAAYGRFAESGKGVVAATAQAHEEVGRQAADAAVEYERQRPEDHATGRQRSRDAGRREVETEPRGVGSEEAVEHSESPPTSSDAGAEPEPASETGRGEPAGADRGEPPEVTEPAEGPELTDLSGVGTAYADRLRAAGIESVADLLDAEIAALSAETEISDERLANWHRQARHMLGEEE